MEALIKSFFEFKDKQIKTIKGNRIMYDVKGHYKYLDESELFNYFIENNK